MTATAVIQPLDTIKVRIQIVGESGGQGAEKSPFTVARNLYAKEGIRGFYKGLDSALFRQATYSTTRLGLYKYLTNRRTAEKGQVKTYEKALISLLAGFVGSLVGNPSDIVLVRFQSDATMPPHLRRNYRHVFDAFYRIVREEGLWTLWRGSAPTVGRAMAMNLGMLTTYDEVKERMNKWRGTKDAMTTQVVSSFAAGLVCSFLSLPFDNAKTKIQKMAKAADGQMPYKGVFDCMQKTVQREGVLGLWVGYPTFYVRVGIHSMIVLLVQDYLQHNFNPHNKK